MNRDLSSLRENYQWGELLESKIEKAPMDQFRLWLEEAVNAELPEPNAMNLSTVNKDGRPSSRIVLLKDIWTEGFVFYTNYNSRKATEIEETHFCALNFLWKEMERQVRIEGRVSKISRAKSEEYFHSRPFGSQVGALCSQQSTRIDDRKTLEERYKEIEARYQDEGRVPLPENWGGFLVEPDYYEFWQGRESRLHDRIEYVKGDEGQWQTFRLEP